MDIKKTFNPSTSSGHGPSTWLRADEMSVLFPILTLYTVVYLGLMIYDFAVKAAFEMPSGLMVVYIAITGAYAADKEIRRWIGQEAEGRKGSVFVYLWLIFYLVAFVISSFLPAFTLPKDLSAVALQVLGIFFGSKASKKIYEVKQTKKEEALSREDKILAYLKEHKEGKNSDFAGILGVSSSTVGRILDGMENRRLIKQHGDRKSSSYTLPQ